MAEFRETTSAGSPGRRRSFWREAWISTLFYGPALLFYIPFFLVPAVLTFRYSLTSWNGIQIKAPFVGLANYAELMRDERFWTALRNTVLYTAGLVLINTFVAMLLAVLLNEMRRLRGVVRSMFFYPSVMSIVTVGALFIHVFNYYDGVLNRILNGLGLSFLVQDWLGDPRRVIWGVTMLTAWGLVGLYTVIYLAALQTIPRELYECAVVDGAGSVRTFRKITFPMLAPAMTTVATSSLFGALALFAQILVSTNGGPGYASMSVTFLVYWLNVQVRRQGYATAVATVLFVLIMLVTQTTTAVLRRRETEV